MVLASASLRPTPRNGGRQPEREETRNTKEAAALRQQLRWCGQWDSNLHALAGEPKGDVTLVKVL